VPRRLSRNSCLRSAPIAAYSAYSSRFPHPPNAASTTHAANPAHAASHAPQPHSHYSPPIPNTRLVSGKRPGATGELARIVLLVATRRVTAGEELFLDWDAAVSTVLSLEGKGKEPQGRVGAGAGESGKGEGAGDAAALPARGPFLAGQNTSAATPRLLLPPPPSGAEPLFLRGPCPKQGWPGGGLNSGGSGDSTKGEGGRLNHRHQGWHTAGGERMRRCGGMERPVPTRVFALWCLFFFAGRRTGP
jgi:hypothetical protein